MPHDQFIAIAVLTGGIRLFARGNPRPDIVGLCAVLAPLFAGILAPKEAFAGFSDPLAVLLAASFVVGGGLEARARTRRWCRRYSRPDPRLPRPRSGASHGPMSLASTHVHGAHWCRMRRKHLHLSSENPDPPVPG